MRVITTLSLLSLLGAISLSAAAYMVLEPNNATVWRSMDINTLRWDRVSSDPVNFTAVLTNTDRKFMKNNNMILAPQVNGEAQDSLDIPPPGEGFPVGKGFRVNLVASQKDVNTIYAQSNEFEIAEGGGSASTTTSTMDSTTSTSSSTMDTTTSMTTSSDTSTITGAVMNVAADPNPSMEVGDNADMQSNDGVDTSVNMGVMGLALLSVIILA